MPRPDIAKLGIKYRRIPILSIGRDVYLDTRLILQKLEELPGIPAPRLGAAEGTEQRGIERLLETLSIDGGVFLWAAALLPRSLSIFKDPDFLKDRADYLTGAGAGAILQQTPAARCEALSGIRSAFELLETTLLADGRDWILKTGGPSLADIEAVWPLHWLSGLPGALPPDQVSETRFPKVFAWIKRFDRVVSAGADEIPSVSGEEAAQTIVGSSYFEAQDVKVDETEPLGKALGLKEGERVVVFPVDNGSTHKDSGVLLGLDGKEVVFETVADVQGSPTVRVHAPRHGYRIVREDQASRL